MGGTKGSNFIPDATFDGKPIDDYQNYTSGKSQTMKGQGDLGCNSLTGNRLMSAAALKTRT